jgi:hypothetical protein
MPASHASATAAAVVPANTHWQQLESRKRNIPAQMGELETREERSG